MRTLIEFNNRYGKPITYIGIDTLSDEIIKFYTTDYNIAGLTIFKFASEEAEQEFIDSIEKPKGKTDA
jgi:hypothetical protein